MRNVLVLIVGWLGVTACSNASQENVQINSVEELIAHVSGTDKPICTLDLTPIAAKFEHETVKSLADYETHRDEQSLGYGLLLVETGRRAALFRRLQMPPEPADLNALYFELDDGIERPETLEHHVKKSDYWDARVADQQARKDQNSQDFIRRFCIINERGWPARAHARSYVLDNLTDGTITYDGDVRAYIERQKFFTRGIKKRVFERLTNPELRTKISHVQIALMRDRDTALISTDPKTAQEFWAERDKEIDAVLAYIETHAFETNAKKLEAMTIIDQTVRHLVTKIRTASDHFNGTEDEVYKGLWTRLFRVDGFNTKTLDEMLTGRDWIRDDIDGKGAAYDAWLIAQHADQNPDFQRRVLKMIEAELGAPGVSKRNYAYLHDRVARKDGKPQRYGTQGRCVGKGKWEPFELEDPDNIDEIRAEVGLGTMETYLTAFFDNCLKDERPK